MKTSCPAFSAKTGASGKLSTEPTRGRSSSSVWTKDSKPTSLSTMESTSLTASLEGVVVKINSKYFMKT